MSLIQSVVSHRQLLLGLVRWSVILKTCCFYAIHASLVINVKNVLAPTSAKDMLQLTAGYEQF